MNMKHTSFATAENHLSATGDRNYCAPLAVAFVADEHPAKVNEIMMRNGRKFRGGTNFVNTKKTCTELGLELTDVTREIRARGGKTIATVERVLDPTKRYLIRTRGHILAFTGGEIKDWTKGRRHIVRRVHVVSRKAAQSHRPLTGPAGNAMPTEQITLF